MGVCKVSHRFIFVYPIFSGTLPKAKEESKHSKVLWLYGSRKARKARVTSINWSSLFQQKFMNWGYHPSCMISTIISHSFHNFCIFLGRLPILSSHRRFCSCIDSFCRFMDLISRIFPHSVQGSCVWTILASMTFAFIGEGSDSASGSLTGIYCGSLAT